MIPEGEQNLGATERSLAVVERRIEARPEVTASDLLHRAADLLEEFGWRQLHVGSKSQGAFCALGATNEARRDLNASKETWREARKILSQELGGLPVATWNDAPERSKVEVVAALRKAAEHDSLGDWRGTA
jgi:hypothetical protein